MLRLFSGLCTLVGFLVLLAGGLYFYRSQIVDKALESAVERETGMVWQSEGVDVDVLKGGVTVHNLLLVNPGHFRDRRCLVIPRIQMEFDLKELQSGRIAIRSMFLEVAELVIVRTSVGESNIDRLHALALDLDEKRAGAPATPVRPQFVIERLDLSAARVLAFDYTASPSPPPITREIGLNAVPFVRINNARDLQRAIFGQILKAARLQIPGMDVMRLAEIAPQPAAAGSEPAPPITASPSMSPMLPKPAPAPVPPAASPPHAPGPEPIPDAPAFPVPSR